MLDLAMFRRPPFTGSNFVAFVAYFGTFSIFFFTALYLQVVVGASAYQAAVDFLPMAAGLIIVVGSHGPAGGTGRSAVADDGRVPAGGRRHPPGQRGARAARGLRDARLGAPHRRHRHRHAAGAGHLGPAHGGARPNAPGWRRRPPTRAGKWARCSAWPSWVPSSTPSSPVTWRRGSRRSASRPTSRASSCTPCRPGVRAAAERRAVPSIRRTTSRTHRHQGRQRRLRRVRLGVARGAGAVGLPHPGRCVWWRLLTIHRLPGRPSSSRRGGMTTGRRKSQRAPR